MMMLTFLRMPLRTSVPDLSVFKTEKEFFCMGNGADSYGRKEAEDPWNEDKRKAYVKRMIKESKDQDPQFRRPDYKAGMESAPASEAPVVEEIKEAQAPQEKKKVEYEL